MAARAGRAQDRGQILAEKLWKRILAGSPTGSAAPDADVSADLYKLLVYDRGAFFKAHRDTEKVDGNCSARC